MAHPPVTGQPQRILLQAVLEPQAGSRLDHVGCSVRCSVPFPGGNVIQTCHIYIYTHNHIIIYIYSIIYCGVIVGYCCNLYDWGAQRHDDILMHCITGASESVALQRCQDHRNVTCYFRLGFSAFSLISCWESY